MLQAILGNQTLTGHKRWSSQVGWGCRLCCSGSWSIRVFRRDKWPVYIDETISIIFSLLLRSGLHLLIQLYINHGWCRLRYKHIKLSLIFFVKFEDLLEAVHYLGEVPTRVKFCLECFVPLKGQLVVNVWLSMVDQLEFDALHWFDSLNVDDTDAPTTVGTRYLQKEFTSLVLVPQKVELIDRKLPHKVIDCYFLIDQNLPNSCMSPRLLIAKQRIFRRKFARRGSNSWSCWQFQRGANFTRLS